MSKMVSQIFVGGSCLWTFFSHLLLDQFLDC